MPPLAQGPRTQDPAAPRCWGLMPSPASSWKETIIFYLWSCSTHPNIYETKNHSAVCGGTQCSVPGVGPLSVSIPALPFFPGHSFRLWLFPQASACWPRNVDRSLLESFTRLSGDFDLRLTCECLTCERSTCECVCVPFTLLVEHSLFFFGGSPELGGSLTWILVYLSPHTVYHHFHFWPRLGRSG